MRANHSAVVRLLDPDRLREVYQIREALEGLAAELACGSFTGEDFAEHLASAVGDPNDPTCRDAAEAFDQELHRLIAQRSGNGLLAREIDKFHILVQLMRMCCRATGALALAFRQHLEIIEAPRTRNAAALGELMIEHIRAVVTSRFARPSCPTPANEKPLAA